MAVERFKTQVLILHPEQRVLDACRRFFGDEYSVHLAHNGREALSTLGETPIDFFVTAQDLPGMSGAEALKEARKSSPETKGILLAPLNSSQQELESLASSQEFAAVLKGNASPEEIRSIVIDAARKTRLQQLQVSANDSEYPVARNPSPLPDIKIEPDAPTRLPSHDPRAVFVDDGEDETPTIDSTGELPTAGMRTHAGGAAVEVLVLSQDKSFLSAIGHAVRGDHTVHRAPTIQEAVDIISMGRVGVLITDAAVIPSDVQVITSRLREAKPSLVTIVAGRRDDGDELMGLIAEGIVYRFLLKPVSPGRARLAIEASVKKSLEYEHQPPPIPGTQTNMRSTVMDFILDDEGGMSTGKIAGAGIALLGLLGLGAYFLLGGNPADETAVDPAATAEPVATAPATVANDPPASEPQAVQTKAVSTSENNTTPEPAVDESANVPTPSATDSPAGMLRRDALRAMAEGRIAMPVDNNALTLYSNALAEDPLAAGLSAEFDEAVSEALSLTEAALINGDLNTAGQTIDRLREVRPYQARLPFLEAQLRKERRRAIVDEARQLDSSGDTEAALALLDRATALSAVADPVVSAAREELLASKDSREIDQLLADASARMAAGQLIRPSDDNARFYYRAVLAREPENGAALQGLQLIGARFLADAESSLRSGKLDAAQALLDTARSSGALSANVNALKTKLDAALETRRAAAEAQAKAEEDKARAEAEAAAKVAAASAADAGISREITDSLPALKQSDLVRVRYVQPIYPRVAVRRGDDGWVQLMFTVDTDGKVKDISVVDSEPGTLFDKAATKALTGWEYQPIVKDGVAIERRATVRMNFSLRD